MVSWKISWKIVELTLSLLSILASFLVVLLTFYLYEKRDKLKALVSLETEIIDNVTRAATIYSSILQDTILRKINATPLIGMVLPPLRTSSYEYAKNSGILAMFSRETRQKLLNLYDAFTKVNKNLHLRREKIVSSFGSTFETIPIDFDTMKIEKIPTPGSILLYNAVILGLLSEIKDYYPRSHVIEALVETKSLEKEEIKKEREKAIAIAKIFEKRKRLNFTEALTKVEEEIHKHPFLKHFFAHSTIISKEEIEPRSIEDFQN